MTKSIIMSVSPEEALNILNGKQTALLRKRIPKDYKGWVYGYVGKGKPYLINKDILSEFYELREKYLITYFDEDLNGTIPFRFWYDEYECYSDISGCTNNENGYECEFDFVYALHDYEDKLEELCLSYYEVEEYGNGKDLYVLKIDNLTIFDEPMQLNDFIVDFIDDDTDINGNEVDWYKLPISLSKPPKTYQYVWVKALYEEAQAKLDKIDYNKLKKNKNLRKLIEDLKFQLHIERLWNIQLEQSIDEMKEELIIHDQANILFDFISENYEQLDSIVARLQKHYNSDVEEYEQQEEDRIILYNLLELHDDLSKRGGMNKERRKRK